MLDSCNDALVRNADSLLISLLKLLAASKPGTKALQLGVNTASYGRCILDGLDMHSRLLAVVANQNETAKFKTLLDSDIRFAVHAQSFAEFLSDINHHRFGLIVASLSDIDESILPIAEIMLPPGGILILIGAKTESNTASLKIPLQEKLGQCFCSTLADGILVAVKLAANHRPGKRQGRKNRLRRS